MGSAVMKAKVDQIWSQLRRFPALEVAAYISLLLVLTAITQRIVDNVVAHAASRYPM